MKQSTPADATWWRYSLVVLVLGWSLQVYAIWSQPYPPLVDLPNHMARHYLEYVQLSGGTLPSYYVIEYRVLPNLGADLVVPYFMFAFDPLTACKLFLTLSVFLYWLGPTVFIVQQWGFRPSALLAGLLLLPLSFSSQFFWGFLNFYSGFGLAFLALAHHCWLTRQDRISIGGLVLHALLVALLFLWHLAPWVIYCVLMACHLAVTTLSRYRTEGRFRACLGRALLFCLPLVPALLLFALYTHANTGVDPSAGYDWGGWSRKLLRPLTLFRTYNTTADLVVGLLWLVAFVSGFGLLCFRGLRWHWLQPGLAATIVLYLVIPFQLGSTGDADVRLLPAILVCAIALLGSLPVQHLRLALILLALCLVVRYGSVVVAWDALSERLAAHAESFEYLEPRSRVLPIVIVPDKSKDFPEQHFLAWAVISRDVFVPTLFAYRDQQPLTIDPPRPYPVRARDGRYELEKTVPDHYDYLWLYNPEQKTVLLPESFKPVYSARGLTLWRRR